MGFEHRGNRSGRVLPTALLVLGLTGAVHAQSATGLGQAWPKATDVSATPHWHVYVFMLNGIEYVQVNDLNGNVHTAVGAAGPTSFVLPVGTDSGNTTVAAPATTTSSETVYSDSTVVVTATPQANGTTKFTSTATQDCGTVYNCGGGRVTGSSP